MKTLRIASLIVFFLMVFVQINYSQKIWEKDWKEWKKEDVYKIMNDSPWARNFTNVDVSLSYGDINKVPFGQNNQLVAAPPIVVRFYSSLILRQSLLRLRQLQANYDKLNDKQKAEFDEKSKSFLNCDNCKNYYVFILLQPVSNPNEKSVVGNRFKDEVLSNFVDKIYLTNDKKEKREMIQFVAPKTDVDAAVFYFPILDDKQNPLITNQTKKITLNFKTSLLKIPFLQDVEFDISKMLINGKLDF